MALAVHEPGAAAGTAGPSAPSAVPAEPGVDRAPTRALQSPRLLLALAVVNTPLYLLLGRFFFGSWEGFRESVYYALSPDLWDWLQGRRLEDAWANLKLLWFMIVAGLLVLSEYRTLLRLWPGLAGEAGA